MLQVALVKLKRTDLKNLKKISKIVDNKFKTNPDSYSNESKIKGESFSFPSIDFLSTQVEQEQCYRYSKGVTIDALFV